MATQTTYTKLRDGSWGLRIAGAAQPGARVSVATKTETVGRVLWTGNGISLATIAQSDRQSTGTDARTMPSDGQLYAGAAGGVRHRTGANRRAGSCERCGTHLAVGAGRLEYCVEDSGCLTHHDEGGYHLYCADATGCEQQRAERRAARAVAAAQRAAALTAWQQIATIGEAVDTLPEWTRTVRTIARLSDPVMPHTGAYPAVYVGDTDLCYHVPGYFACDWDYASITRVAPASDDLRAQVAQAIELCRTAGLLQP